MVRGWAIGLLQIRRDDFYEMRVGEFFEGLDAHRKELEADRRHIGELVRGATLNICNHQRMPKDRIADPAKFWPMPWDDDPGDQAADQVRRLKEMTAEQRKAAALEFYKKTGGANGI